MAKPSKSTLAETHPELAAQADGWDPTKVSTYSHKYLLWKCENGHKWGSLVLNITRGNGCPYCSGRYPIVGLNDLVTTHPELAVQADGWDPITAKVHSVKKVRWKCELGHIWLATTGSRTRGNGCPYCSGRRVCEGFNDLVTTHPELAVQADGWDPTKKTAGSHTKVKWKCSSNHKWTVSISSRTHFGSGCPICSNKRVQVGFNDLATTHPDLAREAFGWDPTQFVVGSNNKMTWICNFGHKWKTSIEKRASGNGCPYCNTHSPKLLKGFNDLATTHPDLAREAFGWDPSTLTHGSPKKVIWICDQGHKWRTSPNTRNQGKTGCPTCAKTGFDPNKSGWLYLVDHDEIAMFQIGISNFLENRLAEHKRRGWEVIELRGPMDGRLTQQLETSCLHALEKRGAILGHKAGIEKFDGYSEAWTKASLNVTSIKQILDWVYEDETK
jgi:hypothetical protein